MGISLFAYILSREPLFRLDPCGYVLTRVIGLISFMGKNRLSCRGLRLKAVDVLSRQIGFYGHSHSFAVTLAAVFNYRCSACFSRI